MQSILTIFKKEFQTFFLSPIAYVFITVYLMATSFLYFQGFFIVNQAEMRQYFDLLPWIFLPGLRRKKPKPLNSCSPGR
jgi:ABC-2 type transport system permease protein